MDTAEPASRSVCFSMHACMLVKECLHTRISSSVSGSLALLRAKTLPVALLAALTLIHGR